jgi:hypothetical protein
MLYGAVDGYRYFEGTYGIIVSFGYNFCPEDRGNRFLLSNVMYDEYIM